MAAGLGRRIDFPARLLRVAGTGWLFRDTVHFFFFDIFLVRTRGPSHRVALHWRHGAGAVPRSKTRTPVFEEEQDPIMALKEAKLAGPDTRIQEFRGLPTEKKIKLSRDVI